MRVCGSDDGSEATLTGGAGNDILLGGIGTDSYQFDSKFGLDTVLDKDGQGSLNIGTGTSPLNGGKQIADSVWESDDRQYRYTQVEGQLIVSLNAPASGGRNGAILVKGWSAGADLIVGTTMTDRMRCRTVAAIVNSSKAANDESIYIWRTAA